MTSASSQRLILVTGAAGFIGSHVTAPARPRRRRRRPRQPQRLLRPSAEAGSARAAARRDRGFDFVQAATSPTAPAIEALFAERPLRRVVHLAAQAGRALLARRTRTPTSTATSSGFLNILEGCRHAQRRAPRLRVVELGLRRQHARCRSRCTTTSTTRVSLYAATKKANELMAHTLQPPLRPADDRACASSPSTGRGGGPTWRCSCSRKAILAGQPIDVFNHGKMRRDFTYIDDIVEGVVRVLDRPAAAESGAGRRDRPDPAHEPRAVPRSTTSATTSRSS